jgi:hypothetical protein
MDNQSDGKRDRNFRSQTHRKERVAAPKNGVNIFVRLWARKEASRGDSERQQATGKEEDAKNPEKRGYNEHARQVGMMMKRKRASEKNL